MSATAHLVCAPAPTTVRGATTKLYASPDGRKVSYASGRVIVIRSLDDEDVVVYAGHVHPTTVARISPSGFYCASGDSQGNVRVWDISNSQHPTKLEVKALAGPIKDLDWDAESKRLVYVGDGKDKSGGAISLDTGASIGELGTGHSRSINAVAMRRSRPLRAATAGDDFITGLYSGVPFRFLSKSQRHARYVQSVAFLPTGDSFVSAGSDGMVYFYAGQDGADQGALLADGGAQGKAHDGTVFNVCFNPAGDRLATCSADRTTKVWDAATKQLLHSWSFDGDSTQSQQVGCCFATSTSGSSSDVLLSLSFSGEINVLDLETKSIVRVIHGLQKSLTALAASPNRSLVAGDASGQLRHFDATRPGGAFSSSCSPLPDNASHGSLVVGAAFGGGCFVTCAMDDTLRVFSPSSLNSGASVSSSGTGGLPKGLASTADGQLAFATTKDVQVLKLEAAKAPSKTASLGLTYNPTAIDCTAAGTRLVVAVGDDAGKVTLYDVDDGKLAQRAELKLNRSAVSALAFCPADQDLLAVGESSGKIILINVAKNEVVHSRWVFHTGRITTLKWSSSGSHLASGSLDTNIYVWNKDKPMSKISIKGAHPGGVSALDWLAQDEVVSVGADGTLRSFRLDF